MFFDTIVALGKVYFWRNGEKVINLQDLNNVDHSWKLVYILI